MIHNRLVRSSKPASIRKNGKQVETELRGFGEWVWECSSSTMGNSPYAGNSPYVRLTDKLKEGYMASTTTPSRRESHKKLKPKPKTESKSWQTRNMARKEKQAAHAAKLAAKTEA